MHSIPPWLNTRLFAQAVLENTLRGFSALTKGETIRIMYNKKEYDIDVVDVQPRDQGAICIIDADVNVDFDGEEHPWNL